MMDIGLIEVIISIFVIAVFYYITGSMIFGIKLTKRRGGDPFKRLKPAVLLFSYIGLGFVMIYFKYISIPLCFLYWVIFLVMAIAIFLFYRKDLREDFTNNLAIVIDEVKDVESFNKRDFLIPDFSFTAKTILKYGPKKAARLSLILGTFLLVPFYFLFSVYQDDFLSSYLIITYILIWLIVGLGRYKKNINNFKNALRKAEKGGYKKDYELFDH